MQSKCLLLNAYFSLAIGLTGALAQNPDGQPNDSQVGDQAQKLTHDATGIQLTRKANQVWVDLVSEPADRNVTIPRFFSSLVSVHFGDQSPHPDLTVHPEPDHWVIRWKQTVKFENPLVLEFDSTPWLAKENRPVSQAGDGTISLHACQAVTNGDKLRFEPQPHKNTVGYWTVATDFATWKLQVDRPGSFNVGLLQGCGEGNGGSDVEIVLKSNGLTNAKIDFKAVETGHFQNFIWRHLGTIHMEQPGLYDLIIRPKKIANKALMDVRLLHLSPKR